MLRQSFIHLPKIGEKTELSLWSDGIHSWDDLLLSGDRTLSAKSWERCKSELEISQVALNETNTDYFAERLPSRDHWRMYREFPEETVFLDIETTGVSYEDAVTTVVTLANGHLNWFVQGENLGDLKEYLSGFRVCATFNGRSFDGPMLKKAMGIDLPLAHIDLRSPCHALNLKGGLKVVEKRLGFLRPPGMEDLDGFDAVRLWRAYCRKPNRAYLETLLAYNAQDTIVLYQLLRYCYAKLTQNLPFGAELDLPEFVPVKNPFQVDSSIVSWLIETRQTYSGMYVRY